MNKYEKRTLSNARKILRKRIIGTEVLTSPSAVKEYLCVHMGALEYEVFVILFLTNQHVLITIEEMFRGTVDGASVYPREVVKRALQVNACAVIFAHNHPSGVKEPSQSDEMITAKLKKALDTVDIRVLDHILVCGNDTVAFSDKGLI